MAVIKFKRGSGVPTGLTAYEAAWDTSAGRFFINNGSTAVWIGARIDPATDLGAAGSCAFFVPTQLAVKTYVDGQVAGGAVSSINGATGVVSILGGTGISVSTSLVNKGITIGVNSNVALLDTAQTFTALKSFSAGLSASGGITFANAITVSNAINAGSTTMSIFGTAQSIDIGTSSFTGNNSISLGNNAFTGTLNIGAGTINLTSEAVATTVTFSTLGKQIQFAPSPVVIMGGSSPTLTIDATDNGSGFVSVAGGNLYLGRITESSPSSRTIAAGIVFEGELNNNLETTLTVVDPTADRTIELPNDSGQVALTKNVVTSVNGTTGAVVDVASLNSATGAVSLFAGEGLSVASSTSIRGITFTNTGVLSVNGGTGAITNIAVTNAAQSFSGLQTFTTGISAASGTFGSAIHAGGLTMSLFNTTAKTINFGGKATTFTLGDPLSTGSSTFNINSSKLNFSNVNIISPVVIESQGGGGIKIAPLPSTGLGGSTPELTVTASDSGSSTVNITGGNLLIGTRTLPTTGVTAAGIIFEGATASDSITLSLFPENFTTSQSIRLPNDSGVIALTKNVVTSVNGSTGAVTDVASLNSATGAVSLFAGAGLSVASSTSIRGITFTNTGVIGLTGTVNQLTVSGTTGSITLSLPSAITVPGSLATTSTLSVGTDLTVTGNLTVNGTTTTVNSTTVTVQDPIIAIGGVTGNAAPPNGDTKDRGIVFQWNNGSAGQTGFFGFDQSTQRFTFLPQSVTVSGEVVSGNAGNAEFAGVLAPQGTLTFTGVSAANATITLAGAAAAASTSITNNAFDTVLTSSTGTGRLSLLDSTFKGTVVPTTLTAARTYTLPNHSGVVAAPTDLGTLNFVLTAQGSTAQPIWVNPASGLTANNANNILTVSDTSDAVCFVTFVANGTNGMQSLKYNPGFTYNAVTNYLEVNIDGGAY